MRKFLSLLFALAMVFSLAARVLAQPNDTVKGPAAEEQTTKKKKHHKKKHKHVPVVENHGSPEGADPSAIGSNPPLA